jgi:peptide/nickel transport system substrate-binding protein/oligopeptide transport system substrate-binding protein
MNVATNLFDGLVEFDKDLNVVPAIASKWKISRDHLTYTFQLRKGVKFHNGREVTAEDFVFSFTRILNPDIKSPSAPMFLNIRGAKAFNEGKAEVVSGLIAANPQTLRIELDEPFAPLLSILATINAKVIPKEAAGPDFGKAPVGTGPFCFSGWEQGKEIVLTANKSYFNGSPYLDRLRFRIYQNIEWEKVFEDFEEGTLDQALIPSGKYDQIMANPNLKEKYAMMSISGINLVYLGMNMTKAPLNDLRVRQAIIHAVDRGKLVKEITKRGNTPSKGILPPGIGGYDPNIFDLSYDPQKSRNLLKEAGYPEGLGIPPIEIWTVSKADSVQNELKAYQRYLADIGIQLVPRAANDWNHFMGLINEKHVPMFYAAWYADFPDPDNFLYVLCHSASKMNRMGYSNPQVDRLLNEARQEVDYMKRVGLYRSVQELVMRDAPILCQHINSFNYLFHPKIKGVELNHLGATYIPYRKVWIDPTMMPRTQGAHSS